VGHELKHSQPEVFCFKILNLITRKYNWKILGIGRKLYLNFSKRYAMNLCQNAGMLSGNWCYLVTGTLLLKIFDLGKIERILRIKKLQ
jgi:hypothetical protein